MIIHLNAVENHLSSLTPKKIVRKGAVNYYEIKVTFSKDWDGLSKVVAIKAPGDEMFKSAYMLLNGRALIPYKDVEEACAARETDDFAVFQAVVYGSAIVGKAGEDKLIPVRIVTNAVTISVDEPEYKGDFYEGLESDEGVNIDVSLKQLAEYAYKLDNYEAYLAIITDAFNEAEEKRQSAFEQGEADRKRSFIDAEKQRQLEFLMNEYKRGDTFEGNEIRRDRQFREAEARRNLWEEYDPKKAYEHGNKVSYKGSSYVMVLPEGSPGLAGAVPGVAKEWLLIAAKGDKGDKGDDAVVTEGSITGKEIANGTINQNNLSAELVRWIRSMGLATGETAVYCSVILELSTREFIGNNTDIASYERPKYPIIVMTSQKTGSPTEASPYLDVLVAGNEDEYPIGSVTSRVVINPYDCAGYIQIGYGGESNINRVDIPAKSIGIVTFTIVRSEKTSYGRVFKPEYRQLCGEGTITREMLSEDLQKDIGAVALPGIVSSRLLFETEEEAEAFETDSAYQVIIAPMFITPLDGSYPRRSFSKVIVNPHGEDKAFEWGHGVYLDIPAMSIGVVEYDSRKGAWRYSRINGDCNVLTGPAITLGGSAEAFETPKMLIVDKGVTITFDLSFASGAFSKGYNVPVIATAPGAVVRYFNGLTNQSVDVPEGMSIVSFDIHKTLEVLEVSHSVTALSAGGGDIASSEEVNDVLNGIRIPG